MNPEDAVIDAIDQLVDEQLAGGPVDDYSVDRYDRCRHCKQGWHGLPNDVGCPGAHARGYQIREWKRKLRTQPGYVKPRYDYVAEIERQTAAIRDRVDREMLYGLDRSRYTGTNGFIPPGTRVYGCRRCGASVPVTQQCACVPQHRQLDYPVQYRYWCTNCMRSVPEGAVCGCRSATIDISRWTMRCAYCGIDRPMEQQHCGCPASRLAGFIGEATDQRRRESQ